MWWRVSSWCRRLIHRSCLESPTAFLTEYIWIESSDLYNFLSGYGSILKNSPQTATARGQRLSNITMQVGLSSVHSSKSFSGDLRHNCAPQLSWRFLLPEQDQQSKRSVCAFTAAPHSLASPAAEAEAHSPFWFHCSGEIVSVRVGSTAQKKEKQNPDSETFRADVRTPGDQAGAAPAHGVVTGQRWSASAQAWWNAELHFFALCSINQSNYVQQSHGEFSKEANAALGLLKIRSQY